MDRIQQMFDSVKDWTTKFKFAGKDYGGEVDLCNDARLQWHIETIGGLADKRVLELGPLEGAHTKTMLEYGASAVMAIEGNPDCWLRCLIVKELYNLHKAKFVLEDFCKWVEEYQNWQFDVVSAAGVLYHQTNPVKLIFDLARITDTVLVWSQVATRGLSVRNSIDGYFGQINVYQEKTDSYCGGLNPEAFWLYPDEMLRCFQDAGFTNIIQKPCEPNVNGDCLLFVAKK